NWQFPELSKWQGQRAAQASHDFLLRQPAQLVDTVTQLARTGWLEPLLAVWDELQLETFMRSISLVEGADRGLTLGSLMELATAAMAPGGLHSQWSMASRRQAIRLWTRLAARYQLRTIWHGLRLLVRFLEQPELLFRADATLLSGSTPFPQW